MADYQKTNILSTFMFVVVLLAVSAMSEQKNSIALFEGDILLTPHQYSEMMKTQSKRRLKRQISTDTKKWTGNTVYYSFSNGISEAKKQLFDAAFAHINSTTCVKFVMNTTAPYSIRIVNGNGCYSIIGMYSRLQPLSFDDSCPYFGAAVHELMHALGIFHTQSRNDRDDYLNVDYSKIPRDIVRNFDKQSEETAYNAVPFEYGSSMIYSANAVGEGSMSPKDSKYQMTMGNLRVSFYDMQNVNSAYNCKCGEELDCKNGGYTNPSNCSKCVCPSGYGGIFCDQEPEGSIAYNATSTWQSAKHTIVRNGTIDGNFIQQYYWITAPNNTRIEVQMRTMWFFRCSEGCNFNGIEIKTNPDPRIVNPIICCNRGDPFYKVYTTNRSPLVIVVYQSLPRTEFQFRYRYVERSLGLAQPVS